MTGPTYQVLPEYTDEAIDAAVAGRNDAWADAQRALRTAPPEWRQSIWAAAHQVSHRTVTHWRREGGPMALPMAEMKSVPTGVDPFEAIKAKVAEFHAGVMPPRMETAVAR